MVCLSVAPPSHSPLTILSVDLSSATVYRHSELESRVAELEGELAALKLAYNTTSDVEKKPPNALLPSLTRQTSSYNVAQVCPSAASSGPDRCS